MPKKNWFKDFLDSMEDDFEFRLESIILEITEKVCDAMDHNNISRAQFADLLGISRPAVTKILNGNSNFTLRTLLSIADALDLKFNIEFKEKDSIVQKQIGYTDSETTTIDDKKGSVFVTAEYYSIDKEPAEYAKAA